jgi:hypothetical protein
VLKVLRDLFTGPDGETWHLGRLGTIPVMLAGLALPYVMLFRGETVDIMAALTGYGVLCGGAWALVSGAKNMDIMPGTPPPVGPAPSGKPTGGATTP